MKAAQKETEKLIDMHRNGMGDQALTRGINYLKGHPNSPGINYALGLIQGSKSNHPKAAEYFLSELSSVLPYQDTNRSYTISLLEQGKNSEALAFLKKQISANVVIDSQSTLLLAELFGEQGDNEQAQYYFLEAIKGQAIGAESEYGKWLVQNQQYEKAVPYLLKSLQKNSDNAAARNNLANALQSLGKSEMALKVRQSQQSRSLLSDQLNHNESSSRLPGATAENHFNLAVSRARLGKLSEALRAYSRALKLSEGRHARAALGLAGLYKSNKQYEEAKKWAIHALVLNPDDPKTNVMIGMLRIISGDINYAQQSFDKVIELGQWSSQEQLLAAKTARDAKNWNYGLKLLDNLPEEDEFLPSLLAVRAQLLFQIGNFSMALNDSKKSISLDENCSGCLLTGYLISNTSQPTDIEVDYWTNKLINDSLLEVMLGKKLDKIGDELIGIEAFKEPILKLRQLVKTRYQEQFD